MKKKGLIISTVVMVVVLIASLTTATYAWFSVNPEATINDIVIETQASTGLEIAAYHIGENGIELYSGDVTLQGDINAGRYWGATDAGDYGSSVAMTAGEAENTLIKNIYATSGDGNTMFVNASELQALKGGKPENIISAVENKNYFALDFTLRASSQGKIFIKELSITPTGNGVKQNMAGSLRVALFATTPSDIAISEAQTWTAGTNGVFCYDPYGSKKYSGGSWANETAPGKVYATKAGKYTDDGVMSTGTLSELWGDKYIQAAVADAFGTSGIQAITKTYNSVNAAQAANSKFVMSDINVGQMMYLRLVVWFDGEDEACITSFAGGGAKVEINFGLEGTQAGA